MLAGEGKAGNQAVRAGKTKTEIVRGREILRRRH